MIEAVKALLREERKAPETSMNRKLEAVKLGEMEGEATGAEQMKLGKTTRKRTIMPIQRFPLLSEYFKREEEEEEYELEGEQWSCLFLNTSYYLLN